MKARVIMRSYHKMHVLKRNIFVSYATKKITKTFRAQIWFRERRGGGGGKGRVAFLHQPHTQPKNKCIYKDKIFNIFQIVMLIQGCNIWETSIPFFSVKVSKPSFRSTPTSSETDSSSSIFVDLRGRVQGN